MSRARIAVLASGGGSNLQALINHLDTLGADRCGDIVLVAANTPSAGALVRAEHAGIPSRILSSTREADGDPLVRLLEDFAADFVVLAGFLKLVPPEVTRAHAGRMVNVHPAPLPRFGGPGMYGMRVHRAVIASGTSLSGPTVHFVDDEYDHGATIAHWPVPVLPGDDEHTLAARVLRAEHLLYPRVIQAVCAGRAATWELAPFDPALDAASLARSLDTAMG